MKIKIENYKERVKYRKKQERYKEKKQYKKKER